MKKKQIVILLIPLITVVFVLLGTNINHIICGIGQAVSIYAFVICFVICLLNVIFLDGIYPLRFKVLFVIAYSACLFLIVKTKALTYPVEWLEYRMESMVDAYNSKLLDKIYVSNHNQVAQGDTLINATIVHPFSTHYGHYKTWMTLNLIEDSIPTYLQLDIVGDSKGYGTKWAIEGMDSFNCHIKYDSASTPDTIALPVYIIKASGEKEPIDTIVLTAVNNKLLQN